MKFIAVVIFCLGLVADGISAETTKTPPGPYDETVDGSALVADALNRAATGGKNVLLMFGANWCSDCRAMDSLLKTDKAIAAELKSHFVLAKIDVGQGPDAFRNKSLVKRFEVAVDTGIPILVVVDTKGRLVTHTKKERLADADYEHPARVLEFLKKWAP